MLEHRRTLYGFIGLSSKYLKSVNLGPHCFKCVKTWVSMSCRIMQFKNFLPEMCGYLGTIFKKTRAQRDSAEKTSKFGLDMGQLHKMKIKVQLFHTLPFLVISCCSY